MYKLQLLLNKDYLKGRAALISTTRSMGTAAAGALRDRKLANLAPLAPQVIVSANIGCIQHLQTGTTTPVKHWVEVLDEALN